VNMGLLATESATVSRGTLHIPSSVTVPMTTCDTPNLERTDAHGGATGPINSPNELHLVFFERF